MDVSDADSSDEHGYAACGGRACVAALDVMADGYTCRGRIGWLVDGATTYTYVYIYTYSYIGGLG